MIDRIIEEVNRYNSLYMNASLQQFEISPIYALFKTENDIYGWPMTWPHNEEAGVYIILDEKKELIYWRK